MAYRCIAGSEKTGGMDLFTTLLARLASPASIDGVIAFVTGAISTYSSTSGVVLPAFLPTIPWSRRAPRRRRSPGDRALDQRRFVTRRRLPTLHIGALAVAAVFGSRSIARAFRQLMAWGLSMIVVGAVLCQLFAGMLAR